MSSFQGRDREKGASDVPNLSEGSMPSGHKPSVLGWVGDLFSKQRRDKNYVNATLEKLKTKEVTLNESIADLKEQLTTLDAQLRKKDEYLKTLTPDTQAWENCLAEMELDLDEESSLSKRMGGLREKLSNARRFIWKIEEGIVLGDPILDDADRLLVILEGQTVDMEVNRRREAKHAERVQKLGIRGSSKEKTSTLEIYKRVRARRGETASEAPADVNSLQGLRNRRRFTE